MDVWWYHAEPSMERRRRKWSEVFQVGCCCSRDPFQGSNCHQSLLPRDAFPILKRAKGCCVFPVPNATSLVCSATEETITKQSLIIKKQPSFHECMRVKNAFLA